MYDNSNTLDYMKIAKTFRLSPEAVAKLDEQDNATQYIEDLILKQPTKQLQVVPYQQVKDLFEQYLNGLSSKGRTVAFGATNSGSSPDEPARTQTDILADIRFIEADYADRAEYCQDADTLNQMKEDCANEVSKLWEEYKELADAKA